MLRAVTAVLLTLFLSSGCGRSQLGSPDSGLEPDGAPPVSCEGDAECDDDNPCNGVESCVGGECEPGVDVVCDDGIECTADTCEGTSGDCVSLPDHERCERRA